MNRLFGWMARDVDPSPPSSSANGGRSSGSRSSSPASSGSDEQERSARNRSLSRPARRRVVIGGGGGSALNNRSLSLSSASTSSSHTLVEPLDAKHLADPEKQATLQTVHFEHEEIDPRKDSVSIPELYYRCHNLSYYPQAPLLARRFLLTFVSSLLNPITEPSLRSNPDCILSLGETFQDGQFQDWLARQHSNTAKRFEAYLARRKASGGQREMFKDRLDAERWCKQSAVVKYVDGSWLQSAFQTTTGLDTVKTKQAHSAASARCGARVSWQVLSEELGDGDLEKEHCAVYERLMDSLANAVTPKADEEGFYPWNLDERGQLPNKQPYVAAMLQLAMSISPDEFLPEMLGFNLSYEGLPYHLLVTSHELRELSIDPYYFVLHISIDNCHSGHSAMARMAVSDFLSSAIDNGATEAEVARLWKRVQSGYVLADSVRTTPRTFKELAEEGPTPDPECWTRGIPLSHEDIYGPFDTNTGASSRDHREKLENELLSIFRAKSHAAKGLHCTAPGRIGGKRIGEWLDEEHLEGDGGETFMRALADSPVWIRRGQDSDKSRLIRECEWGGRMFGAFTMREIAVMKAWAKSLLVDSINEISTPFSAELDTRLAEPYMQYLTSSQSEAAILTAQDYYATAIQPLDLTTRMSEVDSFEGWLEAAPEVYRACLEHAHGVRGMFDIDTNGWLRRILGDETTRLPSLIEDGSPCSDIVQDIISYSARPFFPSCKSADTDRVLATFLVSAAPLEWLPAAGPAKLAGPLGMAVVKIQRALLGFSSEDNEEETCCFGTDDVVDVKPGMWELAAMLHPDEAKTTLASFAGSSSDALALPALIYMLNSQPTMHLPILLGIQLAINLLIHEPLSHAAWTPSESWRATLSERQSQSLRWIREAIDVGSSDVNQRGWEGDGEWVENVELGWRTASRCIMG